jgi:iron(III) transport system permease protein
VINKRGLIKLLAASLVFAALDIWIYNSLLGSYRSYHEANSMKEVTLYARTAPEDPANFDSWIAALPDVIEGARAMILGVNENFEFYPRAGDREVEAIWKAHKEGEEFQRGMESVYYLLPYKVSSVIDSMRVYLLPIPDESGYDVSGAVLMTVPAEGALAFEHLLRNLSILAWLIFTVLFAVAVLARDPITGYSVIFLFAAALTFVAYPLFESCWLTFIEEGQLTFNIW